MKASEDIEDQCEDFHQPQEHEAQQFRAYQELDELVSQPEKVDEPAVQEALVSTVRSQFRCCSSVKGFVVEQSNSTTTHSPVFSCLTGSLTRTRRLVVGSSAVPLL